VALTLRRYGVTRVRPLAGGFGEWQRQGFPVQRVPAEAVPR
jgi:3-mercaptopyruvate sulfurtransferase SseA